MIRVVTGPKVYVVGRQEVGAMAVAEFLRDEGVTWSTDTGNPGGTLVEVAGRLCYMSFARPRPGGNAAYIAHILDVGHGSVLEHAVWGLILTGVSRSLTHELVRHRAGFGFSQLSQRYVDESDVAFVVPPALLGWHADWVALEAARGAGTGDLDDLPEYDGWDKFQTWSDGRDMDLKEYEVLVGRLSLAWIASHFPNDGVVIQTQASQWLRDHKGQATACHKAAREAARSVLPNCAETKIFVTGNARAWRHFCELRANPAADAEMRRLAVAVLAALQAESPALFGDIAADGSTPHHKV